MASPHSTMRSRSRLAASLGVVAVAALHLGTAGPAAAAVTEPVVGGDTKLTLQLPKKVKATPIPPATASGNQFTLPNTGGGLDPATGAGGLDLGGGIALKGKRGKLSLDSLKVSYGPGGSLRSQAAGRSVDLASVSGATATSQSDSVSVSGATASLTSEGAKLLNKKLAKKHKKKKKKKKATISAAKPFKTGAPFGSLSTTAPFATREVLAEGQMELVPDLGTAAKLLGKGINPLTGVTPIAPASPSGLGNFSFPISGGRLPPDLSGGRIETAGGLKLTKNMSVSAACDAAHPVGTFLAQTDLIADLTLQALRATVEVASGPVGTGVVAANLDLSGASSNVNPATNEFTIDGIDVRITDISATTLAFQFGTSAEGCGSPSTDFAGGDPLGTLNISGRLRP